MKTTRFILPILLSGVTVTLPLHAQTIFEGIVESRNMTTDEMGEAQQYTMKLLVKGEMVRTEISSFGSNPASILIYRRDLGLVWVLNEKTKTFFEMRTTDQVLSRDGGQTRGKPNIRKTGKTKKILGYACDQLILRNEDARTEYWGTKSLSNLATSIARAFGSDPTEPNGGMNDELASLGYFPMVVRTRWEGKLIETSEVTRIGRKALAESLFVLPPDFRKESAPGMP